MSVMLSRIEFDPKELADKEEADLEREEIEQQQELRDFLDKELDDDDLFDASFTPHHSQRLNGHHDYSASNSNYLNGMQHHEPNGNYVLHDPYGEVFMNGYGKYSTDEFEPSSHQQPDDYQDQSTVPYKIRQSSVKTVNGMHNMEQDTMTINLNTQNDGNVQLQQLYVTRGRKIEELQKTLEAVEEESAKEKRILQHRLTMMTSERDGLKASNEQLQSLLQDHKKDVTLFQTQIEIEQNEKIQIGKKVSEVEEKLQLSDATIDSLQQQIKQMNQTESLSRARVHHESLLASLRQKHEAEILMLKEKLDDLQQALAWKIEDNNRYKEMLDSNSAASEVGILRHRLKTEENKNQGLLDKLQQCEKNTAELEDQVRLFETIIKKPSQFSSTPFNGELGREKLDFKTPTSRFQAVNEASPETPTSGPAAMKNELVKALSTNREKREEIMKLRNEIERLKKVHGAKSNGIISSDLVNVSLHSSMELSKQCENCARLQSEIELKNAELIQFKADNAEIKANMSDLVKYNDKEKSKESEKQNMRMLQFVDDAKNELRKELSRIHETEKEKLNQQINQLNAELVYTKEEYVTLGDEFSKIEEAIQNDYKSEKELAITELKVKLESEHKLQVEKLQNQLVGKHVQDLESEKSKWLVESEKMYADQLERKIALAKIDWVSEFEKQKQKQVNEAVELTKVHLTNENSLEIKEWQQKYQKLEAYKEKEREEYEFLLADVNKKFEDFQADCKEKELDYQATETEFKTEIKYLKSELSKIQNTAPSVVHLETSQDQKRNPDNNYVPIDKVGEEATYKDKELELSGLLEETREQLKRASSLSQGEMSEDCIQDKLSDSRLHYLLRTKEKLWDIKEMSYKKDIEGLTEDYKKMENMFEQLQKTHEMKMETYQIEKVRSEKLHRQLVDELKEEIQKFCNTLNEERSKIGLLQANLNNLNQEKSIAMTRMEEKFEKRIEMEKKKAQTEASKLQEETLKAESDRLKNNLLADMNLISQNELRQQIKTLTEEHVSEIREMKRNFREKLERINEVKKKWVKDEEEKRKELEGKMRNDHQGFINQLQATHDDYMKEQQGVWEKNMLMLQEEHRKALETLRHDIEQKDAQYRQTYESIKQEKDNLAIDYEGKLAVLQTQQQLIAAKIKSASSETAQQKDQKLEQMRQFYLKALQDINEDVSAHVQSARERAAEEIRKAIQTERRKLMKGFKAKQPSHGNEDLSLHEPPLERPVKDASHVAGLGAIVTSSKYNDDSSPRNTVSKRNFARDLLHQR